MIGKCKSSGAGLSSYLLEQRKGEEFKIVEKHHIYSEYPKGINREFEMQSSISTSRKKINKPIQHIIFSHHKSDNSKGLAKEKEILEDLKNELKKRDLDLEKTQYYIVRHQDKEHLHYHIAFNKVSNDGTSMPMHNASLKCKQASVQISKKHELECGKKTEIKKDIPLEQSQNTTQEKTAQERFEEYEKSLKRKREKNAKIDRENEQKRKNKDRGKGFPM